MRRTIAAALRSHGHQVTDAADGEEAMSRLDRAVYDVVLTDVRLPHTDGFSILRRLRSEAPETEVVLMTAYGTIEDAVAAMKERAFDYVTKPFDMQELLMRVTKAAERMRLRQELRDARKQLAAVHGGPTLIGRSPAITRLREQVEFVAATEASVLICGESGTGKELVARLLHDLSPRAAKPFVAVNCGAMPAALIEAELFGHERGAFTGAVRRRDGRFAAAHGGTLFLDEIGDVPPDAQVKLLRVLQESEYTPVGSNTALKADIRLVSATNKEPRDLIAHGTFREDLFYRIKVMEFRVPPLRERPGDTPLLIEYFLDRLRNVGMAVAGMTPAALAACEQYPFPGNVRELEHAIMHAAVLARGTEIGAEHLPPEIRGEERKSRSSAPARPLSMAVEEFEKEYLRRVLHDTQGKRKQAADILGISRKTLWHKLRKYGIAGAEDDGEEPPLEQGMVS